MKRSVRSHALAARSMVLLIAALICSLPARAETTTYTYDALGRLIQVNGSGSGSVVTYTYDAAGNRTQTTSKSESLAPSAPTGLSATAISQTQINLSWSASTDTGGSGLARYDCAVRSHEFERFGDFCKPDQSHVGRIDGQRRSHRLSRLSRRQPDRHERDEQLLGHHCRGQRELQLHRRSVRRGAKCFGAIYSEANSTPDITPPSTPTGLTAVAASPTKINLSWNASTDTGGSGLAGYKVYRAGSQIGTTAVPSYSDTGRTPSTNYSYTVAAYDNATNTSAQSTSANATTWPAVAASLSTTTWKWIKRGTNPPNIDAPVVCTGSGGSGSGYTYAWQWVSGDTQTSAVSPTSSSTKWSRSVPTDQNTTYTSTWRCQVTDSGGNTGQSATVTVSFTMNTLQFAP